MFSGLRCIGLKSIIGNRAARSPYGLATMRYAKATAECPPPLSRTVKPVRRVIGSAQRSVHHPFRGDEHEIGRTAVNDVRKRRIE
jgi:hypothetical protein